MGKRSGVERQYRRRSGGHCLSGRMCSTGWRWAPDSTGCQSGSAVDSVIGAKIAETMSGDETMTVKRKTRANRFVRLLTGLALISSVLVATPAAAAAPADEVDAYAGVLASQEAFCSWAYQDIRDVWTIGYGFDLRQNRAALLEAGITTVQYPALTSAPGYQVGEQDVDSARARLTQAQAMVVLRQILVTYIGVAKSVFGYSNKEWNAENINRRAAMVSMAYNGWAAGSINAAQIQRAIANENWPRASALSAQRYRKLKDPKRAGTIPALLLGDRPPLPAALCSHAFIADVVASPATVEGADGKPVTVKITATSDRTVIPNTRVSMSATLDDPAIAKVDIPKAGKEFRAAPRGGTGSGSLRVTCLKKGTTTAVVTLTGVLVEDSKVTPTPTWQVKVPVTCDGVAVTTTALPDAQVGVAYSFQLTASGGTAPYVWTGAGLPAGLRVDEHGLISGTPTAAGTAGSVRVTVVDNGGGTDEATLSLAVGPALPPIPPGTPPAPPAQPVCHGTCGSTMGDPHLTTFDGAHYDFQQAGEFVAVASTVDDLQIQVRQRPWNSSRLVSGNTAVAFAVAGHRVGIYLAGSGMTTLVDGQPVTVTATPYALPGGGTLAAGPSGETVAWPDGSFATVFVLAGFLTMNISVAPARQGQLTGLLGDDDGNPADDLTARSGEVLAYPATAAQLYGPYSASWRLTAAESLFDYEAGQSTDSFTDTAFPYAYAEVAGLPSANRDAALAVCRAAGVTEQPYLDSCVLDLALTGDLGTVTAAAAAQVFGRPGNPAPASSYAGTEHNITYNLSSTWRVTGLTVATDGTLSGLVTIDPPLVGNGALTGRLTGSSITFSAGGVSYTGTVAPDGTMSGTYTYANQTGTWTLAPVSTVLAASSPGDAWSDPSGATGTATLTYGHIGCTAVDAQNLCTGGLWPVVPGAPWIWTGQFTGEDQDTVTFTRTVTVTAAQAAQPATLTVDADNLYTVTLNGSPVASGSLGTPQTTGVHLVPGTNTVSITVTNINAYDPNGNPAGLAWKLTAG
ncbi:VWD domain-containing protein [Dactylosporangium sp. CS-047395]|uniref:VWD domain-containing protein n=1 Tax=Dactylosporangium sp. CS-047395 TaxID=3239936 RepID=UPI003D94F856